MEGVDRRTVTYLKERKQFGKAIGEFQALQHRAAHLYCELEVTRSVVLKALQTLDEPVANATLVGAPRIGWGASGSGRDRAASRQ